MLFIPRRLCHSLFQQTPGVRIFRVRLVHLRSDAHSGLLELLFRETFVAGAHACLGMIRDPFVVNVLCCCQARCCCGLKKGH